MSFEIGDTVHTTTGKLYLIQSFWLSSRQGAAATLAPLPTGKKSNAPLSALTLVRSRELSLAFHYAAQFDAATTAEEREEARRMAAVCLTSAEERNVDSRAGLCLGSDRVFELEAVTL